MAKLTKESVDKFIKEFGGGITVCIGHLGKDYVMNVWIEGKSKYEKRIRFPCDSPDLEEDIRLFWNSVIPSIFKIVNKIQMESSETKCQ